MHATRCILSAARQSFLPNVVYDIASIAAEPEAALRNALDRNVRSVTRSDLDELCQDYNQSVELRKEMQHAREMRNRTSKAAAVGKRENDLEAVRIKEELRVLEPRLKQLQTRIEAVASKLPNWSHPHAPIGDESNARVVKTIGPNVPHARQVIERERDHLALSDAMSSTSRSGWFDMATSALTTGTSWPLMINEAAALETALSSYALNEAVQYDKFTPTVVPDVVKTDLAERSGFQPRDEAVALQQTYFLSGTDLSLVGTAEVPLVGMSAGKTYDFSSPPRKDEDDLSATCIRNVAIGRAFRREAGARGQDSRGMYRVHQFTKVELVVVCDPAESDAWLERLRTIQERILGRLGLPLRVLDMPTHELGASAHRKYDIEAWMPGRGSWGELSSASNCTDYQARRLGIRCKPAPVKDELDLPKPAALEATALYPSVFSATRGGRPKVNSVFAHTLNGTAAAVPRLIIALLENGAVLHPKTNKVVHVRLPEVLRRYWIGPEDRIQWVREGEALREYS